MGNDQMLQPEGAPIAKRASKHPAGILLRLILSAVAGTLIGAVVYFTAVGWIPYLDQRVFQPIDNSQVRIQELQGTQAALENQVASLQATLNAETSSTGAQATLAALQAALEQLQEELQKNQQDLANNTSFLLQHTQSLATLDARLNNTNQNLGILATAQIKNAGSQQEIELLKILDLFSRANQFILHDNYGLAENELLTASAKLSSLSGTAAEFQQAAVAEIQDLVDQAIADLPAQPGLAENKIQLAWQLAVRGLPQPPIDLTSEDITPTQNATLTATPTP